MQPGERGTAAEQRANLAATFRAIQPLLRDGPFVVTHGNGPQVGNELLRQELASAEAPPLPLYIAVAQTQAEIGALIAAELEPAAGRPVAVVMTRVEVDEADPAFQNPTKPVGPFYDAERARALEEERGWVVKEDAERGWRRVVPSPRPLKVLELDSIRILLERGILVVAIGGGGVPVVSRDGRHDGIESTKASKRATAARWPSFARAGTMKSSSGSRRGACAQKSRPPSTSSSRPAGRRSSRARKHSKRARPERGSSRPQPREPL